MTAIEAYILAKKAADSAATGISDIKLDGNTLVYTLKDGTELRMEIPLPQNGKDGVSVKSAKIGENNHLIFTLSDDSTIDAGELPDNAGGGLVQVGTYTDLVSPGETNKLYVTLDTATLYYWDQDYKEISGIEGSVTWNSI